MNILKNNKINNLTTHKNNDSVEHLLKIMGTLSNQMTLNPLAGFRSEFGGAHDEPECSQTFAVISFFVLNTG